MKYFILTLVSILFFSSCVTYTHFNYTDPNYLQSDEFSSYEELVTNDKKTSSNESSLDSNTFYDSDSNYFYEEDNFSSRLRRFHRPIYGGYYGGIYTNYSWNSYDPFLFGTSIYHGYNWHSPYYAYYGYTPYYMGYYTPYYYGSYYTYNYGSKYHHNYNNTFYYNNKKYNSYINGRRGSLSSNSNDRRIRVNANNNRLSNLNKKRSNSNTTRVNTKTTRF